MNTESLPIVALVGRPNVGKSTLFNRMTRSMDAIVDNQPGVTRDFLIREANYDDVRFMVMDTGGYAESDFHDLARLIRSQVNNALNRASVIVLVLDGKFGLSPFDREMIDRLRTENKPVLYAVNKIDGYEQEDAAAEFYSLGVDSLFPVSGAHGYGMHDLLDAVCRCLPASAVFDPEREIIQIAVVGKPNAGKSSLINGILKEDRLLVSETAGTTRDAVDTEILVNGKRYRFIDTAGIRKKRSVTQKVEKFSVIKALKGLDRCDIALILMDAADGITEQDIKIAGYASERNCGVIFVLNKWDIVEKDHKTLKRFTQDIREEAKFAGYAPILSLSAKTGLRMNRIFPVINAVYAQYALRLGTGKLNQILASATEKTEAPYFLGRRLKFYYATQVSVKPPSFVCFVNYPDGVHFSYKRYLINQIREGGGFSHTPIRLFFKKRRSKKP